MDTKTVSIPKLGADLMTAELGNTSPSGHRPQEQVLQPPKDLSSSSEKQDDSEDEIEYITGLRLAIVVGSVALACFLMLVDTMIISTVCACAMFKLLILAQSTPAGRLWLTARFLMSVGRTKNHRHIQVSSGRGLVRQCIPIWKVAALLPWFLSSSQNI